MTPINLVGAFLLLSPAGVIPTGPDFTFPDTIGPRLHVLPPYESSEILEWHQAIDSLSADSISVPEIPDGKKKKPSKGLSRDRGTVPFRGYPDISTSNPPESEVGGPYNVLPGKTEECCEYIRWDYHDLRSNPPEGPTCILTKPGIEGLFYRIDEATVDGGTVLQDDFGDFWRRLHDEKYYKLSWWPLGTHTSGNDTIRSASEAFTVILETHGPGSTIDIRTSGGPTTYLLDRKVSLQPFTRIIGQGDTLRRIDTPLAVVTESVSSSEQWIPLSDTSGFKVGQYIMITRGRAHDDVLIPQKKIQEIQSNQIKVQGLLGVNLEIGDTLIVAFNMFTNGAALELGDIYFEGIIFDGNWRSNPYTNSWSQNNSINIANNSGSRLYVNYCGVYDTPSENFVGASCRITNSHFKRLGGSIYHVSVVPDTAINVFVENCWADSICLATAAITSHSEAAIVTSALPNNITLSNCDFSNGMEAIVGDLGGGVNFVSITNGKFRNFKWVVFGGTGDQNQGGEINGNFFQNCGILKWSNGGNSEKRAIDWTIHSNEFINTFIDIRGVYSSSITNNIIRFEPESGGLDYLGTENALEFPTMVHISSARSFLFEGNLLIGSPEFTLELCHGILLSSIGGMDNNPLFVWERDIFIRNNTFRNFHKSITTFNTNEPVLEFPGGTKEYHNWVIADNTIDMLKGNVPNSWGIYAAPGVRVLNNYISTANDTLSFASYPIIAMGILGVPGTEIEEKIFGATVVGNTIIGLRNADSSVYSIYIGSPLPAPNYMRWSNVFCTNNLLSCPIAPISGAQNRCQISENIVEFKGRDLSNRVFPTD